MLQEETIIQSILKGTCSSLAAQIHPERSDSFICLQLLMLPACWVFVLLSNVGWRETTPSAHSLRSHQWFLRLVAQGHISSRALEMFAGITDFLGIFRAHLDESLKNIATLLKIAIKFLGPISYLLSYIGFFFPLFCMCSGERRFRFSICV